jgi:DHA3 family macrolide efflux protein-like MFS transporter
LVETVLSLGTLCGAFTLGFVGGKINKMRAFAYSIGLYGICLIVAGSLPGTQLYVFAAVSAVLGASIPFYSSVRMAIIQMSFKAEYLGRIFAFVTSLTAFATPIGLINAGLFAEKIGIANWYFYSGIAAVTLALISILNPHMKKGL